MATAKHELSFGSIVDIVYRLPLEERLELKNLLEHNIIEARRTGILENGVKAKQAEKNKELVFSNNIEVLKKML